jgi:predicted TPR repeat methyltransferase
MSDAMARARAHFLQGIDHFEQGRLDPAAADFEAALALAPGRPSVLSNLGLTRFHQGRFDEAAGHLQAAATADPEQPSTWVALARCLGQLGRPDEALPALERALSLDDGIAEAWSLRGNLLREARQLPEAAHCFERALALGADPELHRYFLAAVTGGEAPERPPRAYVETLFDDYADSFQQHLVNSLRYQGPERLVQLLREQGAARFDAALDLGCGTGLCGALLRPLCGQLTGVDLSERMVAQARASGHYDALLHADAVEALAGPPQRLDLVIAADVFIYVGRLEAVFAGVARALRPGGWLAFTVERAPDERDVLLLPSLRHAHSEPYLRRLAAAHGLTVRLLQEAPIREDQGRPVPGWYVLMQAG